MSLVQTGAFHCSGQFALVRDAKVPSTSLSLSMHVQPCCSFAPQLEDTHEILMRVESSLRGQANGLP